MGYTPLFDSLLDGTLYGKWPVNGIWALLLSQADSSGCIDMVPQLLAAKIGVDVATLMRCIDELMQPDPHSRSTLEGGRRLVPIETPADTRDTRGWGWRVVNHRMYRDKGRGLQQVIDGRNAEKVRRYKEKQRVMSKDTTGHPQTPTDTGDTAGHLSDKDSYSKSKRGSKSAVGIRLPEGWNPTQSNLDALAAKHGSERVADELARFRDYWLAASGPKAVKSDWDAALRMWMRNAEKFAQRDQPAPEAPRLSRDEHGYPLGLDFMRTRDAK